MGRRTSARWRAVVCGVLAWPAALWAQAPSPAEPQRVEIQGQGAEQQRRASVGALVVVPREELLRHGDTRLAEALRRVPGITVVSGGSRGPEIRMAGLGGGYTQILLNGEPVPPGFALESLSPDLIDRIEISRAASVEQSNQAIAGSVNIILRRAPSTAQREIKLGLGSKMGRPAANADAQLGGRDGGWSWGLGIGLSSEKQVWPMALTQLTRDAAGQATQAFTTDKHEFDRTERLTLAPRASWTISPQQTFSTDHLWRSFRSQGGALDRRNSTLGELPQFARNDLLLDIHGYQLRSRASWTLAQGSGMRWEVKLGYTRQERNSSADFDGYNFDDRWIRDAHVNSLAVDQGWNLSGRVRTPWREAHTFSAGWDADESRRNEDRLQREQPLPGGLPVENLDEIYDARVQRLALFVQDEWTLDKQWTATLGLRWEGLRTLSQGNVFDGVDRRSSVFSPVLQAVWKAPASKDQLRFGLARSYKAPTPRDLMPRRFVANNNSPTTPDLQGNPNLEPELAWGLDAAWEHPLAVGGMVSLSGYLKRIEQVIVDELFQQNGSWVLRRANNGVAWVQGLELEARLNLRKTWPGAPALDLRGNLGINRSRVQAVPGPDNRLAQQSPLTLNLAADHAVDATLSWGASFNLQTAGDQRVSATRYAHRSSARLLDLYASWKPDRQTHWRLSASNLLRPDQVEQRRVLAADHEYLLTDRWRSGVNLRLAFEKTL